MWYYWDFSIWDLKAGELRTPYFGASVLCGGSRAPSKEGVCVVLGWMGTSPILQDSLVLVLILVLVIGLVLVFVLILAQLIILLLYWHSIPCGARRWMGTSPSCQDVDSQPFSLFLHELCQSLPDPATVTTCLVTILPIFKFFVSEIFFLRFPAQRPGLPTFRSYQSNVCASAYNGMPFHPSYIPTHVRMMRRRNMALGCRLSWWWSGDAMEMTVMIKSNWGHSANHGESAKSEEWLEGLKDSFTTIILFDSW